MGWTRTSIALGLTGWLAVGTAGAAELSLAAYLDQVRQGDAGYQAAELGETAARASLRERDLLTSPYFFASAQRADDRSPQQIAILYGDERGQNQYAVGLEERTAFGLNVRLSHQTNFNFIRGLMPLPSPFNTLFEQQTDYYTVQNAVELKQDLWRNFFGASVAASADALEAKARAELEGQTFLVRQIQVSAESEFWALAHARAAVRLQQDLLARAHELTAWTEGRVRLKLMDIGDLYQAQSQEQARVLSLAASQDQERAAARRFNLARGLHTVEVPETLPDPGLGETALPAWPAQAPERGDLKALRAAAAAARQQAEIQAQGTLPELQANVAATLNGLEADWRPAWEDALRTDHYAYTAGVVLRFPLDGFTTRSTLREGYARVAAAKERERAQRALEAQADWDELGRRLLELQDRLHTAQALEQLQQKKAEYARGRLRTGNSVTFQVLQFEQDWGQSQLARLEIEAAIREVLARRKLYED